MSVTRARPDHDVRGTALARAGTAMHQLVDVTARLCRHHGLEVDRAAARLALLTVVDHLDRALDDAELATLATALPLGLSLMVQRRAGAERAQFDLADEIPLRAACEALSAVVAEPLASVLRGEVADVLLGRRPRSDRVDRSGEVRQLARQASARSPDRSASERPTLPIEAGRQPGPTFAPSVTSDAVSRATTRPPGSRRSGIARAG